jgi:hypothetical protein
MKNCKDTIENRTRDLPACSAVSQQTPPPFAHKMFGPFHDVITEFNCTSANYSEIYPLSANAVTKKSMTAAPNSTQTAWLQR